MKTLPGRKILASIFLLASLAGASAQLTTHIVFGGSNSLGLSDSYDSEKTQATGSISDSHTFLSSANAFASYGLLSAGVTAQQNTPSVDPETYYSEQDSGFSITSWRDTITLSSTSLPADTLVQIRFTVVATGSFTFESSGAPDAGGRGTYGVEGNILTLSGGYGSDPFDNTAIGPFGTPLNQTFTGTQDAYLGTPFDIYMGLRVEASAGHVSAATGSDRASAGNPVTFQVTKVEVFDANMQPIPFTVDSASGYDWATVVPEPGSAALLLCGTALLATVRRRPWARASRA